MDTRTAKIANNYSHC